MLAWRNDGNVAYPLPLSSVFPGGKSAVCPGAWAQLYRIRYAGGGPRLNGISHYFNQNFHINSAWNLNLNSPFYMYILLTQSRQRKFSRLSNSLSLPLSRSVSTAQHTLHAITDDFSSPPSLSPSTELQSLFRGWAPNVTPTLCNTDRKKPTWVL